MRIYHIVVSLLFFTFAIVQWNDPDPWLWIIWYSYLGGLSGLAAANRFPRIPILLALVLCSMSLLWYLPDFMNWVKDGMPSIVDSMQAENLYIELVREFLGLVLSEAALVVLWLGAKKKNLSKASDFF